MSLLKKLEARLRRWAIPNPTAIIIAGQVMLYLVQMGRDAGQAGGNAFDKIYLDPGRVLQGEVWRLVTFAFVPPQTALIWAIFGWLIFYFFGTTLENTWGTFRYNVFLFIGIVANIAAAFIAWSMGALSAADNGFLYGTVFLAFARLYPDFVINLFFVLPVRIKWLALVAWIGYGYAFVSTGWMGRLLIIASLLNYFVFFGGEHIREWKQGHRRRAFQARTAKVSKPVHKCLVCGLDSEASPKTAFRYCSKCAGQCCYCPEHIQNHKHVESESEAVQDSK
jgi:membrane associated rhomboid family serine protease